MDEPNKTVQPNWIRIIAFLFVIVLIFGVGFVLGRQHTKVVEKVVTEYVELPPITDSIPVPYPVKEKVDTANLIMDCVNKGIYTELFPDRKDTVYLTKQDSTKIIQDWGTKRDYEVKLFDSDTLGRFTINTNVQYNRLGKIDYTFIPVQKQTTEYIQVQKRFIPFAGIGATTFPSAGAEVGMFFNQNWGFAIDGNYYFNPKQIEGMPKYDVGFKILKMF